MQLGVDVMADDLMWEVCKNEPLIQNGASEEEPEARATGSPSYWPTSLLAYKFSYWPTSLLAYRPCY